MAKLSAKHYWLPNCYPIQMPEPRRNIKTLLLLSSVALMLFSCYPEYKLGKAFIESKPDISILVLTTDYVFKTNLKHNQATDTTGMTQARIDSARLAESRFLKEISDSAFLESFINSMITEFGKLGIKVYVNSTDSFLFLPSPAYILNLAQIEIEEFTLDHKDSEVFEEVTYYKTIPANAVSINTWFELSWLNPKKEGRKVFYASETISDIVDGYFSQNLMTGQVYYKYELTELDNEIIYRFCDVLGKRYAGYTFDYLMNLYIMQNFPPDAKRQYYMRYDRMYKLLEPTRDARFEILEDQ